MKFAKLWQLHIMETSLTSRHGSHLSCLPSSSKSKKQCSVLTSLTYLFSVLSRGSLSLIFLVSKRTSSLVSESSSFVFFLFGRVGIDPNEIRVGGAERGALVLPHLANEYEEEEEEQERVDMAETQRSCRQWEEYISTDFFCQRVSIFLYKLCCWAGLAQSNNFH